MSYGRFAASLIFAELRTGACSRQSSISFFPSIKSRTPSSVLAPIVYSPETGGINLPVQRAEKKSALTPSPGEFSQRNEIFGSIRVRTGSAVQFMLLKYSPRRPSSPGLPFAGRSADDGISSIDDSDVRSEPLAW